MKYLAKVRLLSYGLFSHVYLEIIGKLPIADVILACTLPFTRFSRLAKSRGFLKISLGFLLLFCGQVISDVANATATHDYFRGWALIAVGFLATVVLTDSLIKDPKALLFYLVGLGVMTGFFPEASILDHPEGDSNYFKVRYVEFLNTCLYLIIWFLFQHKTRLVLYCLIAFYSFACFYLDARSNGLALFMSLGLLLVRGELINKGFGRKLFVVIVVLCGAWLAYGKYVDAVIHDGLGGRNADLQLSVAENPYNPFELLVRGRSDVFSLVFAISDKPLLGHGSWGKDPEGKYSRRAAMLRDNLERGEGARGYINAHSVILGFWVYAGLIGFFGICLIYYCCLKLFLNVYRFGREGPTYLIIMIMGTQHLWAAFFSPVGVLRTTLPIFIALLLAENHRLESEQRSVGMGGAARSQS